MYKVSKIRTDFYQVFNTVTKEVFGGYTTKRYADSVARLKNIQAKVTA